MATSRYNFRIGIRQLLISPTYARPDTLCFGHHTVRTGAIHKIHHRTAFWYYKKLTLSLPLYLPVHLRVCSSPVGKSAGSLFCFLSKEKTKCQAIPASFLKIPTFLFSSLIIYDTFVKCITIRFFWDVKFYIPLKYEIIPKNLKWITYYSPKLLQNQSLRWLLTSHRSNATICRQKSWFYCTFDLHDGNHFWYLGNRRLHFWAICNITSTTVAYGYWAILTFSNDHIYDKINDKIIQKNQSKMIITSSLIFQT